MRRSRIFRLLRLAWLVTAVSATGWLVFGFQAVGVPPEALQSDAQVTVMEDDDGLDFQPRTASRGGALLFLPGGMVDSVAYVPLMRGVAMTGHRSYLLKLPWRCGCTDSQISQLFERIRATINAAPGTKWTLAGHSRGGMLASSFARDSSSVLGGLVLIGTTIPATSTCPASLSPWPRSSVPRTELRPPRPSGAMRTCCPPALPGSHRRRQKHVQFGYYRHHFFDGRAAITRDEQHAALIKALRSVLADSELPPLP